MIASSAPWLTVVMPCYRGEQWIAGALASLAAEADPGIEVLVVDGTPGPAARDIAWQFADQLRLQVLQRCDLQSWQAKTNFAVRMAASDHVSWLGVDDLWLPGRAAALKSWIGAAPEAPLHLCASTIIDKNGRRLGVWRCPLPAERALGVAEVAERLLVQNFVSAPAPVFRKDAWLRCGGVDEALWYTADWDVWLKLAACGATYYHDAVTIGFRIHEGSLTITGSRDPAAFVEQMQIVLERHLDKLGSELKRVEPAARASIMMNAALAAAAGGDKGALMHAACQVARLGPAGIRRYFRDSRIWERAASRVRAKLNGGL